MKGSRMISTHNKTAMVCMNAKHAQKTAFSCVCEQNMSPKTIFLVHVSLINKTEASSLIDLKLALREAE